MDLGVKLEYEVQVGSQGSGCTGLGVYRVEGSGAYGLGRFWAFSGKQTRPGESTTKTSMELGLRFNH